MGFMPRRVQHAARFALATLIAVYFASALWELLDIYVLGNLPNGASQWATFLFNEQVWRTIAIIEAIVVFLLKLGDVTTDPPSWLYAWLSGIWVAVATITIGIAVEERQWWTAVVIAVVAIAAWYLARNRIPGRPGTNEYEIASLSPTERETH
jgi:hypothetical protein